GYRTRRGRSPPPSLIPGPDPVPAGAMAGTIAEGEQNRNILLCCSATLLTYADKVPPGISTKRVDGEAYPRKQKATASCAMAFVAKVDGVLLVQPWAAALSAAEFSAAAASSVLLARGRRVRRAGLAAGSGLSPAAASAASSA